MAWVSIYFFPHTATKKSWGGAFKLLLNTFSSTLKMFLRILYMRHSAGRKIFVNLLDLTCAWVSFGNNNVKQTFSVIACQTLHNCEAEFWTIQVSLTHGAGYPVWCESLSRSQDAASHYGWFQESNSRMCIFSCSSSSLVDLIFLSMIERRPSPEWAK